MGAFQTEYKLLRRVWYPKIYIIQALENSAQLGEKKDITTINKISST